MKSAKWLPDIVREEFPNLEIVELHEVRMTRTAFSEATQLLERHRTCRIYNIAEATKASRGRSTSVFEKTAVYVAMISPEQQGAPSRRDA